MLTAPPHPLAGLAPGDLDYKEQNETLLLTIEALKAQMEDQAKLAKEEVYRLALPDHASWGTDLPAHDDSAPPNRRLLRC